MAEFASKGVAGAGLGLGIAGTALGVMNGGLGNLLGGVLTPRQMVVEPGMYAGCNGGYGNWGGCCSENMLVNRYEAGKDARIAELETEVKLRDANTYTDSKLLELYRHVDHRFGCIEGQIAQQAVYNATNTAQLGCMAQQIAALQGLTKVVIPTSSICPEVMPRYNSWTAPTTEAPAGA